MIISNILLYTITSNVHVSYLNVYKYCCKLISDTYALKYFGHKKRTEVIIILKTKTVL